ncbi:MAG: CBS domain-containing protein [Geminicoccaceae bacterium]|jgi:CBS domain-containing protein
MFVHQILDSKGNDIVTVGPKTNLADVAKLMGQERVGAVVVLDDDTQIAGIVSERDITRGLAEHGAAILAMSADQVMTAEVVTCGPDDGVDKLMQKMTAGRFRHLPVLDKGSMVGIVSIGDVVKSRLEELETEASMLQDYIAGAA